MIKKLDLYMSKCFIKYFLISNFSFLIIFLLAQMFKIIRYINEGKLIGGDIFIYIVSLIPKIFIDIAPLSVLLSGLIMISIMASNLEIISLKSSGIRFLRIVLFPLIISFLISIFVFYVNNSLYTKALVKINMLRGRETIENLRLPTEKNNVFLRNSEKNYFYYMKKINRKTGEANYVEIVLYDKNISEPLKIIAAKRANYNFEKKIWQFKNVSIYNLKEDTSLNFKDYENELFIDEPTNFIRAGQIDPRMLSIKELKKNIKENMNVGMDIREYLVELAKRYSFPFSSFIVAFIGLSLGSKYVRGGKTTINLIICVALGYGYYLLSGAFEAMSINSILNPFLAMWIPNIIYLIVGLYFMNKAEY